MLCSHIMQYTCFTLFNYDKQTLWRACMSTTPPFPPGCMWCLMHDLGLQCGTGTAWQPRCGQWWTDLVERVALLLLVLHTWPQEIGPAVVVWRHGPGRLWLELDCARSWDVCVVSHVRHHWNRFRCGTYAYFLLVSELPRLQLITQPECSARDSCHMESQHSCSLFVQEQNNRTICHWKCTISL